MLIQICIFLIDTSHGKPVHFKLCLPLFSLCWSFPLSLRMAMFWWLQACTRQVSTRWRSGPSQQRVKVLQPVEPFRLLDTKAPWGTVRNKKENVFFAPLLHFLYMCFNGVGAVASAALCFLTKVSFALSNSLLHNLPNVLSKFCAFFILRNYMLLFQLLEQQLYNRL